MRISNKLLNILIIGIYVITLFLGNSNLLGFIEVGDIINYIIVLVPSIIILLILFENRKNLKCLFKNKVSIFLGFLFIIWSIFTIILGINIGMQSVKALIHFGVVILLGTIISQIQFSNGQKSKLKKHFFISFGITLIYGIIEYIFKFNLDIYSNGKYPGMNGRVYSTFYIATLYDKYIAMMSAFVCYEIQKIKDNKKYKYMLWFLLLLSGICVGLTFSRTGLLLFMANLVLLFFALIYRKKFKEIILIFIILGSIFCIPGVKYSFSSSLDIVYSLMNNGKNNNNLTKIIENNDSINSKTSEINDDNDPSMEYRDYYKKVGKTIMREYPIKGIGLGNYSYIYNNQNVKDFIENDNFIEIKYMYPHSSLVQLGAETGYIGVFLFYIFLISLLLPLIFSDNKFKRLLIIYVILQLCAISYVEGIIYAKQYIYLFIIIYSLYINSTKNKKIKDNKISFLLLHLGYGGIETATINTANALCDKYDIELVSFYELSKNQCNKIDNRITVKYLYNSSPNKEEFLKALKEHKYFRVLKEGIKSIDILIKKKIYIIKSIIDCDSKYIISTRWDFSLLLSRFGSKENIKIAQEHHYHNNDKKYISKLKKYHNIDYLFALTKVLEEDYKKFLSGNNKHTKVVLVPNMVNEIPNKESSLKEKNIVTISRLDTLKKNDDIIKAFSKIKEKDWNLYIIGDGNEYNNLINLVEELKLKDRVILTGYKTKEEIEEYLLKSSIFLMASVTEGLPMVLLEAMSYGVPCIAYETPSGTSDIIKDNINGYIIKDRNENEYVEKIEHLINNENLREKLGNNAKKTVNDFSKEQILKMWYKILK